MNDTKWTQQDFFSRCTMEQRPMSHSKHSTNLLASVSRKFHFGLSHRGHFMLRTIPPRTAPALKPKKKSCFKQSKCSENRLTVAEYYYYKRETYFKNLGCGENDFFFSNKY